MSTKADPSEKILAAVMDALPGRHLEIWSKVKASVPDVHPAEVWRCMANAKAMKLDLNSGIWSKTG